MTGFLAQEVSSILSETITIDSSVTAPSSYFTIVNPSYTSGSTITITNSTPSSNYSWVSTVDPASFRWKEEFDGVWPEWNKVQEMCKEYPGLDIAFEKFKTVYLLLKDEHDAKLKNQIP